MASILNQAREILSRQKEYEVGEWSLKRREGNRTLFCLSRQDDQGRRLPALEHWVEFPPQVIAPQLRYALECEYVVHMGSTYDPRSLQSLIALVTHDQQTHRPRSAPLKSLDQLLGTEALNQNNGSLREFFDLRHSNMSTGRFFNVLRGNLPGQVPFIEVDSKKSPFHYAGTIDLFLTQGMNPEQSKKNAETFLKLWNELRYGVMRVAVLIAQERHRLNLPLITTEDAQHEMIRDLRQSRKPYEKLLRNIIRDGNQLFESASQGLSMSQIMIDLITYYVGYELCVGVGLLNKHEIDVFQLDRYQAIISRTNAQYVMEFPGVEPSEPKRIVEDVQSTFLFSANGRGFQPYPDGDFVQVVNKPVCPFSRIMRRVPGRHLIKRE